MPELKQNILLKTRCSKVREICKKQDPEFKDIGNGHYVACHLVK